MIFYHKLCYIYTDIAEYRPEGITGNENNVVNAEGFIVFQCLFASFT